MYKHAHPFIFSADRSYFPIHVLLFPPLRLVHSGPGKSSPLLDSDLSFGLRSGTKQGVETHVFRVDSAKELSTWTHLLVEGCHSAAELIKEVTTGADTQFVRLPESSVFVTVFPTLEVKDSNFKWKLPGGRRNLPQIIALSLGVAHSRMNEQRKAVARGKILSLSRCRKKTSHGVLFLVKCKEPVDC